MDQGHWFNQTIIYRTPDPMEQEKLTEISIELQEEERIREVDYKILKLLNEKDELKIEEKCSRDWKEKRQVKQKIKRIQKQLKRIIEEEQPEFFE